MSAAASKHSQGASVLAEAARHESAIMARIAAAEQEAQNIINHAHEQAANALLESQQRTERDIAQLRHKAAEERDAVERSVEEAADQKVASIRAQAAPNLERVQKLIVARILPGAK